MLKVSNFKKYLSRALFGSLSLALLAPMLPINAAPAAPDSVSVTNSSRPTVSWNAANDTGISASEWVERTGSAAWSARFLHATVVFDNKIWVMGGSIEVGTEDNDVWYSADGKSWTMATSEAGWSPRRELVTAVFDGKMWVFGGAGGSNEYYNDIWYSEDGINWTLATDNPGWAPRSGQAVVEYNGKLWSIGGGSNIDGMAMTYNDIWYSEDGINWTLATDNPGWGDVSGRSVVSFNGKLLAMGGLDAGTMEFKNDIWSSVDGINWQKERDTSVWEPRFLAKILASDNNNLWLLGGINMFIGNDWFAEVWHSSDGLNWQLATDSPTWTGRLGNTVEYFDGRLWFLGGRDDTTAQNDVHSTIKSSISHYKLCWDNAENSCSNSVKVSPSGNVIASNDSALSKLKQIFLPSALAATNQISYTFTDPLEPGTWYFSVYSVDGEGNQSVLGATASVDITPGMPEAGDKILSNFIYLLALISGALWVVGRRLYQTKVTTR